MSQSAMPCHEIVLLHPAPTSSREALLAALRGAQDWLQGRPGFVSRTLREDTSVGLVMDHVTWASRDAALAAAKDFDSCPAFQAIGAAMDPHRLTMLHLNDVPAA